MKKIAILFLVIFSFLSTSMLAQRGGALYTLGYPRFAKAIRLGNAYTGIAEGSEALFYNPAGIANQDYYSVIFSKDMGAALFIDDFGSMDYSVVAPLPKNYGSVGIMINTLWMKFGSDKNSETVYSIHYARKIKNNFFLGISGGLYSTKFENLQIYEPDGTFTIKTISASAFGLSLSALYSMPEKLKLMKNDDFKIGFQFKNIVSSKLKYEEFDQEDVLFQNVRAGVSYKLVPDLKKIYGFYPIKFLAAFDAVFKAADYNFETWQPNYGLEVTLLEILKLSFGRENEIKIEDVYSSSVQFPVNRFGFGLIIPVNKFLRLKPKLDIKFNYAISDWQKLNETEKGGAFWFGNEIDDDVISAELKILF